ncbi:hypothetical protein P7C73_g4458, partial [Tremellales sp. Uapishka_1]
MPSTTSLPPRTSFSHNEILHSIALPPLATFLSGLSATHHLLKLQDVLERFRTPSSYHRIDVRHVESSELPPEEEQEEYERVERGSPVILPESVELASALLDALAAEAGDGLVVEENPSNGQEKERTLTGALQPLASTSALPSPPPHTLPVGESTISDSTLPFHPPPLLSLTAKIPSPHLPLHPLPPIGPPRRIRELRLDLRSLDAAALFALETWRRDELGLPKLDRKVPDSIWYKVPTPSPPPRPPSRVGRPRKNTGRPRKSAPVADNYEGLVPESGNGEENQGEGMGNETIIAALSRLFDQAGALESTLKPPSQAQSPPRLDPQDPVEVEAPRSPSPDIILDDNFDENDAKDPSFVPPRASASEDEGEQGERRIKRGRRSEGDEMPRRVGRPRNNQSLGEGDEVTSQTSKSIVGGVDESGTKRKPGRPRKNVSESVIEQQKEAQRPEVSTAEIAADTEVECERVEVIEVESKGDHDTKRSGNDEGESSLGKPRHAVNGEASLNTTKPRHQDAARFGNGANDSSRGEPRNAVNGDESLKVARPRTSLAVEITVRKRVKRKVSVAEDGETDSNDVHEEGVYEGAAAVRPVIMADDISASEEPELSPENEGESELMSEEEVDELEGNLEEIAEVVQEPSAGLTPLSLPADERAMLLPAPPNLLASALAPINPPKIFNGKAKVSFADSPPRPKAPKAKNPNPLSQLAPYGTHVWNANGSAQPPAKKRKMEKDKQRDKEVNSDDEWAFLRGC